jgi:hypothetical protein
LLFVIHASVPEAGKAKNIQLIMLILSNNNHFVLSLFACPAILSRRSRPIFDGRTKTEAKGDGGWFRDSFSVSFLVKMSGD